MSERGGRIKIVQAGDGHHLISHGKFSLWLPQVKDAV